MKRNIQKRHLLSQPLTVEEILVMDNASMHRHIDPAIIARWLEEHRFLLVFLPPYSPELNLIEILWKQAKYHWRSFTSWTRDALVHEVQSLLEGFGKSSIYVMRDYLSLF